MTASKSSRRETFIARAFRLFKQTVRDQFHRVKQWWHNANQAATEFMQIINEWMLERKLALIIGLSIVIWIILIIWFLVDAAGGKVQGNVLQVGIGGAIGSAIIGLIISFLIGLIAFLLLFLLVLLFRMAITAVLFVPLIPWIMVYTAWRALVASGQLLLLIPLFVLFVVSRLIQLWRGIFYTCP
jgi:hypothetical protein